MYIFCIFHTFDKIVKFQQSLHVERNLFYYYTPFTRAKLKTLITQNADEKVETSNAADTLEDNLANLASFFV